VGSKRVGVRVVAGGRVVFWWSFGVGGGGFELSLARILIDVIRRRREATSPVSHTVKTKYKERRRTTKNKY